MKIISLNIWGGKIHSELKDFVWKQRESTDIFCFQEVFDTTTDIELYQGSRPIILREIRRILNGWDMRFSPGVIGEGMEGSADINLAFGLCIFSKKPIDQYAEAHIISNEDVAYPLRIAMRRTVQALTVQHAQGPITVFNYHGIWNGRDKADSAERDLQSKQVRGFMNQFSSTKHLLVGDLNLNLDAVALSELKGNLIDLVATHNIPTTRSSYYEKRSAMPIADYALVDPGLQVKDFSVLPDEVSDHLALQITI